MSLKPNDDKSLLLALNRITCYNVPQVKEYFVLQRKLGKRDVNQERYIIIGSRFILLILKRNSTRHQIVVTYPCVNVFVGMHTSQNDHNSTPATVPKGKELKKSIAKELELGLAEICQPNRSF